MKKAFKYARKYRNFNKPLLYAAQHICGEKLYTAYWMIDSANENKKIGMITCSGEVLVEFDPLKLSHGKLTRNLVNNLLGTK